MRQLNTNLNCLWRPPPSPWSIWALSATSGVWSITSADVTSLCLSATALFLSTEALSPLNLLVKFLPFLSGHVLFVVWSYYCGWDSWCLALAILCIPANPLSYPICITYHMRSWMPPERRYLWYISMDSFHTISSSSTYNSLIIICLHPHFQPLQ